MDPRLYFKIHRIFRRNAESLYTSYFDQNELLEELPSALKNEVLNSTHKNILNSLKFFKNKPISFVMDMLPKFTRTNLPTNEVLYRTGDIVDEGNLPTHIFNIYLVFFIVKGRVGFIDKDGYLFRNYVNGSYFGDQEIYDEQAFREHSVMSMEDTELLVIKKKSLLNILLAYPEINNEMIKIGKQRSKKNSYAIEVARKSGYLLPPQKYIYIYIYIDWLFSKMTPLDFINILEMIM